jgi:hypothetical protein
MKPSDELSELIRSMSPSEKRYFKLQAATFKEDSHYLLLFDAIDKKDIEDNELVKYLELNHVTVPLSRLKNYLQQLLMKTLREYHLDHYPEFKIIEAYRDYRILRDRKLDKQAGKSIARAVKLAKQYERYAYLWEINRHLAGDNMVESDSSKFRKTTAAVLLVQDEALEKLKLIGDCHRLEVEAILMEKDHIKTIDPAKLSTIEQLLEAAKALDNDDLPCYGKAHLHGVYNICYAQTNRYEEALKINSELVTALFDKAVEFGCSDEQILYAYTNQLYHLIYQGKIDEFKKLTSEIKADVNKYFVGHSEYYEAALLFSVYSFEVSLALLTGNFKEGEQYVGPAQKILEKHSNIAYAEFLFSCLYRMIVLYFGLGKYDKALNAINTILDGKVLKYGPDFGPYIRMLNLIVLYELGHYKMLPSAMKATEQFIRGKEDLYVVDKLLLEMLKKFLKATDDASAKAICTKYAAIIKAKIEAEPSARTPLIYFDFLTWMEGKAKGKLFGEAMKQKSLKL